MCRGCRKPRIPGSTLAHITPSIHMDSPPRSSSSPTSELVMSFKKLLSDTSGDLNTLKEFDDILSDEIERASNASSDAEVTHSDVNITEPLSSFVDLKPGYLSADEIHSVTPDVERLFTNQHSKKKYSWLSKHNIPYKFGGKSYQAQLITGVTKITAIMEQLNADLGLELDSWLVIRYLSNRQHLNLHQDNEDVMDQSHPICNISIGSTRQLKFWNSETEETGQLISNVTLAEGSLLLMKPGCQTHLWHKVPPGTEVVDDSV